LSWSAGAELIPLNRSPAERHYEDLMSYERSRSALRIAAASAVAAAIVITLSRPAAAVRADECEQQRARYPRDWIAVAADATLFKCQSHYSGALVIKLARPDRDGRALMSLVPVVSITDSAPKQDFARPLYRIWLDTDQVERLRQGKYFGTVVRTEDSCWIRGDLGGDPVFFMDNASPAADSADAGAFYNLAPRISGFLGHAYVCEPAR
jgi:hypothetical protein